MEQTEWMDGHGNTKINAFVTSDTMQWSLGRDWHGSSFNFIWIGLYLYSLYYLEYFGSRNSVRFLIRVLCICVCIRHLSENNQWLIMSLLRIEENTKYYTRATLAVSCNNRGKLRPGVRGLVFGGSSRPIPDWDRNRETIIIKQRNNIVNHHPVYRVSSLTGLWIVIQTFLTSLTCQLLIGNGAQSPSLTNNFWTKKLCSCKTRLNNYINKYIFMILFFTLILHLEMENQHNNSLF